MKDTCVFHSTNEILIPKKRHLTVIRYWEDFVLVFLVGTFPYKIIVSRNLINFQLSDFHLAERVT